VAEPDRARAHGISRACPSQESSAQTPPSAQMKIEATTHWYDLIQLLSSYCVFVVKKIGCLWCVLVLVHGRKMTEILKYNLKYRRGRN
jgi:hypothetical protein